MPVPIDRAELTAAAPQQVLARLLVQRAAAQKSQLWDQEERFRREIGQAEPLKSLVVASLLPNRKP